MIDDWININVPYVNSANVNLDEPIIAVPVDAGIVLPIDGWHRIAKGIEKGYDFLPCHLLTNEESNSIQSKEE